MIWRFAAFPLLQLLTIACLLVEPQYAGIGMGTYFVFGVVADNLFGETREIHKLKDQRSGLNVPNICLFSTVPLHIVLGFVALINLDRIDSSDWLSWTSLIVTIGLFNAFLGVIVGHELIHGRGPRVFNIGQLCVAFSCNPSLAIDHLYGHHINVGLLKDKVTARRGESFWRYLPRALAGVQQSAWLHEKRRLTKRGKSVWSWSNRALFGYSLVLILSGLIYVLASWVGLFVYFASALIGMVVIEAGNYIGHYGVVRAPGAPVAPRHAWNNFNRISTSFMFNLPRHSDHHMRAEANYWELAPLDNSPVYPYGYGTMTALAMLPPIYFRIVAPEMKRWNEELASPAELALLADKAA